LGFYPSWLQEKMVALPGDIIYGKAFAVISKKKNKGPSLLAVVFSNS